MKSKLFATIIVLAMLLAPLSVPASASPSLPDYKPVDLGPELRAWEATPERIAEAPSPGLLAEAEAAADAEDTPYTDCVLDSKLWLSLDNYLGNYFFTTFYLVAESAGAELWVQADLSWPEDDPRPAPVITCEQAAYLVSEFDNNMYPIETSFFGLPDFHDGMNSLLAAWGYVDPDYYYNDSGRQVILVSNIRDDNYYDPTYPNYIAGFYSPTFEGYFDRNIMSIDSYDWANRVGPDGSRPYLYEGVFAHEFQHLLHDDYDSDEVELVNEGLSMFAEYLTGYVVGEDQYSTFQQYPENSLPVWEDQGGREIVADYGLVFLFQMYLMEKFGQEFIQAEFMNPDNGITSINSTLDMFNIQRDFADLYHDFKVAVLIDSKQGNWRYGFEALEVGIDIGTPDAPNPEAFDTPGAPPWGTDYIWIEGAPKDITKFVFNGVDLTSFNTGWTSDGDVLWSGTGDLLDQWAIFETTGGGVLSIDTIWDLEDYWDFGFVQVSTDGGQTWTSLEDNEGYSTYDYDPNALPKAIENLPGLTSWLSEWVTLSYDLSPYAGQEILVAFRLVTDWATHYGGWWIDNIYMDGEVIFDGSSVEGFMDITELFPVDNDFTITFVGIKEKGNGNEYKVHTMKLDDITEEGIFELTKVLNWSDKAVMLVTFDAPEDFTGYGEYDYEIVYRDFNKEFHKSHP